MDPTPSWLRASSMDVSQSGLSGAMFAEGFAGGRMPAADAGALGEPGRERAHDHGPDGQ